ncbi:V-set domain-containing T-cell activation inhibitor 1-like isoform X4 [Brachyhypopomus gauderio]|uniref:V-set domain-containing T-cell activation inhibitor 1-like isoform X4 n=1 Tax=Brachyhypopomus gauderio TaxID=698409 RepID=UPI0040425792
MGNRNCFYFMFLWLIHRASLKNIPVVAVVHGTVILPCSHNDEKLRSGSAEIFWRYGDSRTVLDLKGNTVHVAEQDEMFRGRVDNFPGEYTKGNFSIRLRDVKLSDAGTYTCFIPLVAEEQKLDLTVEERKSSVESAGSGNGGMRGSSYSALLIFTSLLGFFVLRP